MIYCYFEKDMQIIRRRSPSTGKKAEEYLARAERFKWQTNDRDSEDGVLCVVC